MSYRIAGVDVHKKMLAVVVSNVEIESGGVFPAKSWSTKISAPGWCRILLDALCAMLLVKPLTSMHIGLWMPSAKRKSLIFVGTI